MCTSDPFLTPEHLRQAMDCLLYFYLLYIVIYQRSSMGQQWSLLLRGEQVTFLVQKKLLKNHGCSNFQGDEISLFSLRHIYEKKPQITWMWFIPKKKNIYEYLYLLISSLEWYQDMETGDVRLDDRNIITKTRRGERGIIKVSQLRSLLFQKEKSCFYILLHI